MCQKMSKLVDIADVCDEVCDEMPFSETLIDFYKQAMKNFFYWEKLQWPRDVLPVTKLKIERIEMDIIEFIDMRPRKYELGGHFQLCIIEVIRRCEIIVQQQRQNGGDWLSFDSPYVDMREHWEEMPLQCPYIINING